MNQIPLGLARSSWRDNRFPTMLWASVLQAQFDRTTCLHAFRRGIRWWAASEARRDKPATGSHVSIASMELEDQIEFVRAICGEAIDPSAFSSLLLVSILPDYKLWQSVSGRLPDFAEWEILERAAYLNADHQTQEATDLRWIRVMIAIASGTVHFPETMRRQLDEFNVYPNEYDQRQVRPSIRALEMQIGKPIEAEETQLSQDFWNYVYDKSPVRPASIGNQEEQAESGHIVDQIRTLRIELTQLAASTRAKSFDAKHDVAFGIAIAGVSVAQDAVELNAHQSILGQMALRYCVEAVVNLGFLAQRDDLKLWETFKDYGYGQAKLVTMKAEDIESAPSNYSKKILEMFVEEELIEILRDVQLKDWTSQDTRKRAEYGGQKDLYDTYWQYSSAFVHPNWLGTALVAYDHDVNALHRLQRVPKRRAARLHSVGPDLVKVCNRLGDIVRELYKNDKAMKSE